MRYFIIIASLLIVLPLNPAAKALEPESTQSPQMYAWKHKGLKSLAHIVKHMPDGFSDLTKQEEAVGLLQQLDDNLLNNPHQQIIDSITLCAKNIGKFLGQFGPAYKKRKRINTYLNTMVPLLASYASTEVQRQLIVKTFTAIAPLIFTATQTKKHPWGLYVGAGLTATTALIIAYLIRQRIIHKHIDKARNAGKDLVLREASNLIERIFDDAIDNLHAPGLTAVQKNNYVPESLRLILPEGAQQKLNRIAYYFRSQALPQDLQGKNDESVINEVLQAIIHKVHNQTSSKALDASPAQADGEALSARTHAMLAEAILNLQNKQLKELIDLNLDQTIANLNPPELTADQVKNYVPESLRPILPEGAQQKLNRIAYYFRSQALPQALQGKNDESVTNEVLQAIIYKVLGGQLSPETLAANPAQADGEALSARTHAMLAAGLEEAAKKNTAIRGTLTSLRAAGHVSNASAAVQNGFKKTGDTVTSVVANFFSWLLPAHQPEGFGDSANDYHHQ